MSFSCFVLLRKAVAFRLEQVCNALRQCLAEALCVQGLVDVGADRFQSTRVLFPRFLPRPSRQSSSEPMTYPRDGSFVLRLTA